MKKKFSLDEIEIKSIFTDESPTLDSISSKISDRIEATENLSFGLASHPFVVDKFYFDNLETEILKQTSRKKKTVFYGISTKIIRLAASVILLIGFSVVAYFQFSSSSSGIVKIEELSNEEILAYLDNEQLTYEEITEKNTFNAIQTNNLIEENFQIKLNSATKIDESILYEI